MKPKIWQDFKITTLQSTDDKRVLKGRAINYNKRTLNGTLFRNLNFIETLPALFNHNTNIVIGNVQYSQAEDGIDFEMSLNPNTVDGKEAWEKVKHGDLTGVSIGAYANEWDFEDIDGVETMVVTDGELFELSLVTVPADPQARIQEIQSLKESSPSNVSRETMKGDKMDIQEKQAKINELKEINESLKATAEENVVVENFNSVEEAEQKVKTINEAKETIALNKETIQTLESEIVEETASIAAVLNAQLKSNKKTKQNKKDSGGAMEKTNEEQLIKFLNQPHIVAKYKETFIEAAKEGKDGISGFKKYLEQNHKTVLQGFDGTAADLTPTTIVGEVADTMSATGRLTPFLDVVTGITSDLVYPINTGEDLGYGWQGNSAAKTKQNNMIKIIKMSLQYIYKYVDVSREWLDQPNDVIYNYVIKELAQRLQLTIERSVLIGDPTDVEDKDKITSIKPIKRAEDISVEVVNATLKSIQLPIIDAAMAYRIGQTVFVASATVIATLVSQRNETSGIKLHDVSSTTIDGRNYTTIDGYVFIESMFMPHIDDIAAGELMMLGFKSKSYVTVFKDSMAEMFQDFKLETNTREFLTEVKAAGNLVKPSCAVVVNMSGTTEVK